MKMTVNGSYSDHETPPISANDPSAEIQYLVKWCKWSHLHNTWETEATLLAQNVKGMKKFYNFLKREQEREAWEASANPEDIEYAKCQEEMAEQLMENVTQVERVIGECVYTYTVHYTYMYICTSMCRKGMCHPAPLSPNFAHTEDYVHCVHVLQCTMNIELQHCLWAHVYNTCMYMYMYMFTLTTTLRIVLYMF